MSVKDGVEMANSKGPIPPAYFEAISDSPEEAEAIGYKVNAKRHDSQKRADLGWNS